MGVTIAASSVWVILKRHGVEPAPQRSGPTWAQFLSAQAKGLMACDFFHVDTVLFRRFSVLVFIHHDSRFVRIAGITSNPVAAWVTQCARNLSMELSDQANPVKFLVCDRDTKFTASFDAVLATEGTITIKSPVPSLPFERTEPTPSANGSSAPYDASASNRGSSSTAATSKPCSPSTSSMTTHIDPTGPSANDRPLLAMRPLPPSATSSGYEEPTVWVASSMSTR